MKCICCNNFVHDHLENLSLKNHPLESFVRTKKLQKYLQKFLGEFTKCLEKIIPFHWNFQLNLSLDERILYENSYLEYLETSNLGMKEEFQICIVFLLESGIVSGKYPFSDLLARQFLGLLILYFSEHIPNIHNLHTKQINKKKPEDDEEDLYR
jgi:hypothetical protein